MTLRTAEAHYARIAAVAAAASVAARTGNTVSTVVRYQAAAASAVTRALTAMLAEQRTPVAPRARIQPLAFTAEPSALEAMMAEIDAEAQWQIDRLVQSLVTDAARAAESVSIATRPDVGYVRYLSPPSCARCTILAGRFYRWSEGFQRHPGCDCTHVPTTDPRSEFRQNPHELAEQGLVSDLSKADKKALDAGADLNRLVNMRGLQVPNPGNRRPSPAAIFRSVGDDRDAAVAALTAAGYIR